ncbi:MAG: 2-oxoacid:acceptor oxidoreductase family protein [Candidatus Tectomicrobia bacterium]|uniref:2-oxoacid:acceptor oxidoreductase family protein n=1 Tax=Tectimicrobiota bacterium TaxID=2528274 RepID=A0A933LRJ4_UNCTE|nr:2-oxoacid:acceptor oxidoreductase family protein [Candidatus Tectomicrobia bacterium]
MTKRYEVRLSGAGGQGLILAGVILAEAAAIYDGKNALQSQSYGPEARGGASKSEVIISDEEIDYPKATQLDALLALTQEACHKYYSDLKEDGFLLVDSDFVTELPPGKFKVYKMPIFTIASKELGKSMAANIIALGALVELSGVVSHEALEQAVLARVPKGTEELNRKALNLGYSHAIMMKR